MSSSDMVGPGPGAEAAVAAVAMVTRSQSDSKVVQKPTQRKAPGTKVGFPQLIYDGSQGMLRKCTFCRASTAQVKLLWIPAWMLGYNENILEKWGLMCKRCYVRRRDWDEAILVLECEWPWDQRSMCVGPNSAIMSNASDASSKVMRCPA